MPDLSVSQLAQKRSTPLRLDGSAPTRGTNQRSLYGIAGYDPIKGSGQSIQTTQTGTPVQAIKNDLPSTPGSLQASDRAAYGVGEFKGIPQGTQQIMRTPAPGAAAKTELEKYIAQQNAMLDPNYNWNADEGTQGVRNVAETELNALRAKVRDTMQGGGASAAAIARETAKWDSQTRGDVLKYIADRKLQVQQQMPGLISESANLDQQRANFELQKQKLMNDYLQQKYEREQADPFTLQNLGKTALNIGVSALGSGTSGVIGSLLSNYLKPGSDPNEIIGTGNSILGSSANMGLSKTSAKSTSKANPWASWSEGGPA